MPKQIVDGVDVSGCANYTDELKGCSCRLTYVPFHYRFCEQNPNCHYKNWQRAEKKLERISKVCDKFIPDHFKILLIINGGMVEE